MAKNRIKKRIKSADFASEERGNKEIAIPATQIGAVNTSVIKNQVILP